MRTLPKTLVAACVAAFAAVPAAAPRAQDSAAVAEAFGKLVVDGCIPHMKTHASLAAYAKTAGLEVVQPELANSFLRTSPGIGYLKADAKYPMLLFGVADGSCRVYARFAPDLEALAEGLNKKMISAPVGFTDGGVSTGIEGPNSLTVIHRYNGKFGTEAFSAVLTTTPARNTPAQVSFVIKLAD